MSNEPRMVVLQSADGYSFAVEEYVAMEFGILKELIKNNKTDENTVYPLPGVTRNTLSILIDYFKIYHALSKVASNSDKDLCRHSLDAAFALSCNNEKVEPSDKEIEASDKETVPGANDKETVLGGSDTEAVSGIEASDKEIEASDKETIPGANDKETVPGASTTEVSRTEASDKETVAESKEKKAVSEVEASDKETVPKREEKRIVSESQASDKETVTESEENKDVPKGEASDKETVPEIEGKNTKPEIGGFTALLEIKLDKTRKAEFVVKLNEEQSSENDTSSGKKVLLKVKPSDEKEESSYNIKLLTEKNKET